MREDPTRYQRPVRVTVNAGDIARLADVGRAAVSNWRRRYEDFPRPVGGTASSPLFSLTEVEEWLRRNGKAYTVSLGDRVWQRLRAAGGDLRLGDLVAAAGEHLVDRTPGLDEELVQLLDTFAAAEGARAAYEFLYERYAEAHSRRLDITPPDVAALMARLAPGRTVLDPACGVGTLLLATEGNGNGSGTVKLGQELDAATARIAAARLALTGADTQVRPGNSLRADAYPQDVADAVLCHPPFNERAWGHEELTTDPRWAYGVPPRGEPELAWVQHCLAHVRPGGLVAILMPSAAAGRRAGRRIRGNLLRAGALRAVVTLSALPAGGLDLWLLRRPERGERPPAGVLVMDASGDVAAVEPAWRGYLAGGTVPGVVPIVGLLDDEVDVGPARHRPGVVDLGEAFAAAAGRLRTVSLDVPELSAEPYELETTTLAELARTGAVEVEYGRAGVASALTPEDLLNGEFPEPAGEAVVVASAVLGVARVVEAAGLTLGPQLTLFRVDPERLDPHFLAGCLRAGSGRGGRVSQVSSRIDARRIRIPRLPIEAQRAYGAAFRRLASLEDALRTAADAGEEIIRLGVEGLAAGLLRPPG